MTSRPPFQADEWYHCYNRGIDKRVVFEEKADYTRFLELLYLTNTTQHMHRSDLAARARKNIFQIERKESLTSIGAFCLMPNHFHLLLKETTGGGITSFMQRLGTAYTMYFNIKNERSGNLFMRPFHSRHVGNDNYFQHVINYIHCNPAELYEPSWKKGTAKNISALQHRLIDYPYSSLGIFEKKHSNYAPVLDGSVFKVFRRVPAVKMVREALAYYKELMDIDNHVKATP